MVAYSAVLITVVGNFVADVLGNRPEELIRQDNV